MFLSHSSDFYFMIVGSLGALVSFLIALVGRSRLKHWHTYSVLANVLSSYMVILSMRFGEDPGGLVILACWNVMIFMALSTKTARQTV